MINYKKWIAGVFCIVVIFYVFKQDLVHKPYHYCRSLSANIETVEITIPKKQFQILDSLRNDVLKNKKVRATHKRYVKASLKYNNEISNVKIRLKGDQLDHYNSNPPSYRVKVVGNKKVLETNKFSLQSFGARHFMTEWIFLKILEQQDVLSLRSDVVELNINNTKTICTFEEHFTYHLTDRFNRAPGPIICISEDLFWNHGRLNDSVKYKNEKEIYLNSPIKEFKYYAPLDSNIVKTAKNLLNDFRNKQKDVNEVFDVNKLAIHLATSDLTNTHHGLRWHNRRFYYNPLSGRLEPIGFDGSNWKPLSAFAFDDQFLISLEWSNLFSNKEFVKAYLFHLDRMSKKRFLDQFFNQYDHEINELENRIYKENLFHSSDYNFVYINAAWIRENINEYKKRLLMQLK
jgi:hypothetical protein